MHTVQLYFDQAATINTRPVLAHGPVKKNMLLARQLEDILSFQCAYCRVCVFQFGTGPFTFQRYQLLLAVAPHPCRFPQNTNIKTGSCAMLIPYTDWAHKAHSVPFEQSKNAHSVPSLSGALHMSLNPYITCFFPPDRLKSIL